MIGRNLRGLMLRPISQSSSSTSLCGWITAPSGMSKSASGHSSLGTRVGAGMVAMEIKEGKEKGDEGIHSKKKDEDGILETTSTTTIHSCSLRSRHGHVTLVWHQAPQLPRMVHNLIRLALPVRPFFHLVFPCTQPLIQPRPQPQPPLCHRVCNSA